MSSELNKPRYPAVGENALRQKPRVEQPFQAAGRLESLPALLLP